MGCIRESKNVDLVVGPSALTEEAKAEISGAIARYRETKRVKAKTATIAVASVILKAAAKTGRFVQRANKL